MVRTIGIVIIIGILVLVMYSLMNIVNATDSARVNVSVYSNIEVNFSLANINFGYGSVESGMNNATIDSTGIVINGNWTPVNSGFVIENTGNWNATLAIRSNKDANDFIGGTNPRYYFNVSELEEDSCYESSGFVLSEWRSVNTSEDGLNVCDRFYSRDDSDLLRIDIRLVIPTDSNKGPMNSTISAIITAV